MIISLFFGYRKISIERALALRSKTTRSFPGSQILYLRIEHHKLQERHSSIRPPVFFPSKNEGSAYRLKIGNEVASNYFGGVSYRDAWMSFLTIHPTSMLSREAIVNDDWLPSNKETWIPSFFKRSKVWTRFSPSVGPMLDGSSISGDLVRSLRCLCCCAWSQWNFTLWQVGSSESSVGSNVNKALMITMNARLVQDITY
jgi:hypothetical protein